MADTLYQVPLGVVNSLMPFTRDDYFVTVNPHTEVLRLTLVLPLTAPDALPVLGLELEHLDCVSGDDAAARRLLKRHAAQPRRGRLDATVIPLHSRLRVSGAR